ncbi:thermonuclease family protein [Virgibacillus sp. C22-A2]|uniref:Thermonuclease family protein n=1 Tax=Virgibacillus tibetensis TaxID=3042313 RepID=A0ABU6KJU2_9BACI|nr:thermonuclease family protein [Virgibacillus sp. C22-A2]
MKKISIHIIFIITVIILTSCTNNSMQQNSTSFVRVVDGDTLIASIDGTEEYVRLLLVDTPETKHPDKGKQPYGEEASMLMENTFSPSDPIKLEYGTEKRDKYDRILAYVYTEEGEMFNEMLLEEGLARVAYVFPPNDKYVDEFRKLEQVAKDREIGIWSIEGYVTDYGFDSEAD